MKTPKGSGEANDPAKQVQLPLDTTVQMVKKMLDNQDDFLLVDCREPAEFEICKIDGAVLIPMNETPNRISELEAYRDKTLVVHCHHGGRSYQVVQWLRSQGFSQSQNMAGGIEAWSLEIDESVPRY